MLKLRIALWLLLCGFIVCPAHLQAVTYVYVENNSSLSFAITSQQTGTHTMDPSEWGSITGTLLPWEKNKNVLWTNRDQGVHDGDDFYFDTWLVSGGDTLTLQVKLTGTFVHSDMWQSVKGPGFNHAWYGDRNFHEESFQFNGKSFTVKYTAYATGGDDDILFAIQENDPWPVPPGGDHIIDIFAYNIFMLSWAISQSDQSERAAIIPEHVKDYDALILSEAFDNDARDNILVPALLQYYPHKTAVVDAASASEDGGVMIMSKWPIVNSTFIVYDSCDGSDCLAAKGAMYAKIDKNGRPYHLIGTHTQAWQTGLIYRQAQFRQLRAFIDALNIPANEPVLLGGDLNVDKILNNQNEYTSMFSLLNAAEPRFQGHGYTYDPGLSYYASGGDFEFLDYVLHLKGHLAPLDSLNEVRILRSIHDDVWEMFDLSDHFGVWGHFEFPTNITAAAAPAKEQPLLTLFPNPVREASVFLLDAKGASELELEIFDSRGRQLAKEKISIPGPGLQRIPLPFGKALPGPGIYFYKGKLGKRIETGTFLITAG